MLYPSSNVGLCVLALAAVSPCVFAQGAVDSVASLTKNQTLIPTEVGGIITGQTITLVGKVFYDSFAAVWRDKDESGHFVVSISERPSARWGSQVFVDYRNRRLYQTFLPPNLIRVKAIGESAAEIVFQAIIDYQIAQFFGDRDLARDEF